MDGCGHEGHGSGDAWFEVKRVAHGVHVVVAAPAHSKPSAARVIVERLRDITPEPVRYVIDTHVHWDHRHGNAVYPAAYPRGRPPGGGHRRHPPRGQAARAREARPDL